MLQQHAIVGFSNAGDFLNEFESGGGRLHILLDGADGADLGVAQIAIDIALTEEEMTPHRIVQKDSHIAGGGDARSLAFGRCDCVTMAVDVAAQDV